MQQRLPVKQTEVGLIPDDWEVKKLSDVSDIKAPMVNPLTRKYDFLPHIGNENIEKFTGKLLPYNLVGEDQLISGKYYFKSTDVLYGKINPQFSKVAFPEFEGLCSADIYPLSVKEGMIPLFLKYSLLTKSFYEYTVSSSTRSGMPKVNRNEISGYLFAVPPLPDQQRIAKALSDVDTLISTTEKLIQKKKNIKQGTMQNLLTGKKRLPGFGPQTKSPAYKQTELGPIPEDWEVKSLGKMLEIGHGKDYKNLKYGNVPVYGTGGYMTSVNDFLYEGETVCIGRKGTIDKPQYHSGKIWTVDTLFYTYDFKSLNPKYLFYKFCLIDWLSMNEASGVPSLTAKNIEDILIAIPTEEEQTVIANVLSNMDKEIETLNTKLEKYRNLKTAMMQQLLTGKIRLVK